MFSLTTKLWLKRNKNVFWRILNSFSEYIISISRLYDIHFQIIFPDYIISIFRLYFQIILYSFSDCIFRLFYIIKYLLDSYSILVHFHRLSRTENPSSLYSCLLIQSWWNVPNEARIDPPSHPAYFRSVDDVLECNLHRTYKSQFRITEHKTLTPGAMWFISNCKRSRNPGNSVFPPHKTMFWYMRLRRSGSSAWIDAWTTWGKASNPSNWNVIQRTKQDC